METEVHTYPGLRLESSVWFALLALVGSRPWRGTLHALRKHSKALEAQRHWVWAGAHLRGSKGGTCQYLFICNLLYK